MEFFTSGPVTVLQLTQTSGKRSRSHAGFAERKGHSACKLILDIRSHAAERRSIRASKYLYLYTYKHTQRSVVSTHQRRWSSISKRHKQSSGQAYQERWQRRGNSKGIHSQRQQMFTKNESYPRTKGDKTIHILLDVHELCWCSDMLKSCLESQGMDVAYAGESCKCPVWI